MQFFRKIWQLVNKPFPSEESKGAYFRNIAFISLFVFLFLLIFQPFGISTIESGKFIICLGFASMSFIACSIFDLTLGNIAKRGRYTFGVWILEITGLLITISFANFLFARIVLFGYINWEFLPDMIYATVAIGIFPILVLGTIAVLRIEKKYQGIAREINERKAFASDHATRHDLDILNIPVSSIRYVEALQNYVKIGHVRPDGTFLEITERATLKSVLEAMPDSRILRCHRSFLVNHDCILSADGNAQGLLLSLAGCDKRIPVSRSYVGTFR